MSSAVSFPSTVRIKTRFPDSAGFASFVREHRAWRNAAIAVVGGVGLLNLALLLLTAGF
jgi:hypothetical protein